MNRSILIVICDFLLVSLLAFSTVDIDKVQDVGAPRQVKVEIATRQADSGKDLAAVMRLALDEERRGKDQLLGELTKARDTLGKQQTLLTQRDQQVGSLRQDLESTGEKAARLQQAQTNLQQQFASAQASIQNLSQQLKSSSAEAQLSKERLAAAEAEMRKQVEQAAVLQARLAQLAQSNQAVLSEKQQLAGRLQVAEAEKHAATAMAVRLADDVKVERAEKAKLAEGVKALASKSDQLAQEVRENRPLAPNTIFSEFATNRVTAQIDAFRSGLFGSNKRRETETVLVTDGTNTFALCHVDDTPLVLWNPGTDWEGLTGTLSRQTTTMDIRALCFHRLDPRVVLLPLSQNEARQLGCKVYRTSPTPFKFQDAVLIGARAGYYGECRFEIDLGAPEYLKLDRNFLKGLFGKFNPSRGDLVFSKSGELLGVMANGSYCLMLRGFNSVTSFQFGPDVRAQHTGSVLARLYSQVTEMPFKLQ